MCQINPQLAKAHYAIRGELAIRAEELKTMLSDADGTKSHDLPFNQVLNCNIGDPLQFGQKPITFLRRVQAFVENPDIVNLTNDKLLPTDVITFGNQLLKHVAIGPYSNTKGPLYIRNLVANFIKQRDGYEANPESIFLTNGASHAIASVLTMLVCDSNDGIMLPVPQYPLYAAQVTLLGAHIVSYELDEDCNWSLEMSELEKSYRIATERGIKVKAMVVINPGNPTGNHLTDDNLAQIVQFCHKKGIALLADEVYQENVYVRPFKSFKKSLCEYMIQHQFSHSPVELYSFHSVSKGFFGECGRRGGYVECFGVGRETLDALYKLLSLNLCSNVGGQIAVAVMVNPPTEGSESYAQFVQEKFAVLDSYKRKAAKLHQALNDLPGVSCNRAEGALYLFPRLQLPDGACEEAANNGRSPDEFYCLEMLNQAGICVIPGEAFGQKKDTFHLRITILPPENEIDQFVDRIRTFHNTFLRRFQ